MATGSLRSNTNNRERLPASGRTHTHTTAPNTIQPIHPPPIHRSTQRTISEFFAPVQTGAPNNPSTSSTVGPTHTPSSTFFGDQLNPKEPTHVRILYANINGLHPMDQERTQGIKQWIRHSEADICGMAEINTQWTNIPREFQTRELFRSETPLHYQYSFNKHDPGRSGGILGKKTFQQGGTMTLALDVITARLTNKGQDETGLGRWSWLLFHGKHGTRTRIITAYQPVNSREGRLQSVYSQQRRWLRRYGDKTCPRKAFLRDLLLFLQHCRQNQERIVLLIDANDDIRSSDTTTALADADLLESITSHHSSQPPPATHRRGSKTIDGIFLSPELQPSRAGFLSFDSSPGDHRAGYIDISWTNLLGEDVLCVPRPTARRLNTMIPQVAHKYNSLLSNYQRQHGILSILHQMYTTPEGGSSAQQQMQLESIDRQITEGMLYAERRCRKLAMGGVDFSPKVDMAYKAVQLWTLVYNRKEGKRKGRNKIRRLALKLKITRPMSLSIEQTKEKLIAAKDEYKQLKKKAPIFRRQWLTERMDDPTIEELARRKTRQLLRTEDAREASRKIRRIKNKIQGKSIEKVEHIVDGVTVVEDTQSGVEEALAQHISERYSATNSTAFMQPELREYFGLCAESAQAQQMLQGTLSLPEDMAVTLDTHARDVLDTFRYRGDEGKIDISISAKDFTDYWKKAKERTSSSLSGRHFGHYKAAAMSKELAELHAIFLQLSYCNGHRVARWERGLMVMLEKEPGNAKVDKLRAILLMEADFNFVNKLLFGKRMMGRASAHNLLKDETFGSVRHRNAQQVGVTRRCVSDLSRMMGLTMAMASVDASQCYDRIQHTVASFCLQSWGVPMPPIKSLLGTVQQMKFHLRTSFGDSDTFFTSTNPETPFQGILQGNGAGPAVWLTISTFLLETLYHRGHISNFTSPTTRGRIKMAGLLFVDDTDIIVIGEANESALQVQMRLQEAIDAWQGALQASGGTLQPSKCTWSLMDFHWRQGSPHPINTTSNTTEISVASNGARQPLQRLKPNQSSKAVGFTQSMDGSMSHQLASIKKQADQWATNIARGLIDRRTAWTALRTTIWPSIKFPLAACTVNYKQGDKLLSKLYKALLPALGANRCIPKIWRYSPLCFMGLELYQPNIEQGIEQLKLLLTMGASSSLSGKLLRAELEAAQLLVGTQEEFLNLDFVEWSEPVPKNTLAKSQWQFVDEHDITIRFETSLNIPLPRANDHHLMDLFFDVLHLDSDTMASVNRCRIATNTLFLSDVCEGCGMRLDPRYLNTTTADPCPRKSTLNWPKSRPTRGDWDKWRHTLTLLAPQNVLPSCYCLGTWRNTSHQCNQWRYHALTTTLWHPSPLDPMTWERYSRTQQRASRTPTYSRQGNGIPPQQGLQIATTSPTTSPNDIRLTGYSPTEFSPENPPSLHSVIQSMGEKGWPLATAQFPDEGRQLKDAITQGTARGVSDGSYKREQAEDLGTAGWIIFDPNTRSHCGGVVQTTGQRSEVNAYRSELQGLHAMLLAIKVLCIFHEITHGAVCLGLDNEGAVHKASEANLDPPINMRHADLIRAIRRLIAGLPIKVHLEHVRGHQDEVQGHKLSLMEHLNTLVDSMAKDFLDVLLSLRQRNLLQPCNTTIAEEGVAVYISHTKLTGDPTESIRRAVFSPAIRTKLDQKGLLPEEVFDTVDWQGIGKALGSTPNLFRLWATKHASGHCAVGSKMKLWGFWDTSNCPLCGQENETSRHVMLCPATTAHQARDKGIQKLLASLKSLETHQAISDCFIATLSTPQASFSAHATPWTAKAAMEQDDIGWLATTEGRISKEWRVLQGDFIRQSRSKRTIENWAAGIIKAILEWTHSVWKQRCHHTKHMERNETWATRLARANETIEKLLETPPGDLLAEDRYLLSIRTPTETRGMCMDEKEIWIQAMTWATESALEERNSSLSQMRNNLASWLAQE